MSVTPIPEIDVNHSSRNVTAEPCRRLFKDGNGDLLEAVQIQHVGPIVKKNPKQVLHVERVSQTLRKGESTLFRGKLLVYGESRPEITCIQYDIQRQHTLKQETIKSALEAGV